MTSTHDSEILHRLRLLILTFGLLSAAAAEDLVQKLYPAGGGSFEIRLSPCRNNASVLNGSLKNNTDTTWRFIEIQVKAILGNLTTTHRFNIERVGEKDATFKQSLDAFAGRECAAIRLSELELIAAYSETREANKKQ